MVTRIKANDRVVILSGKDRGKIGAVIEILSQSNKIMVKDIAVVTRHSKARRQGEVSAIKRMESYIDLSRVMPLCSACDKPTRLFARLSDKNVLVRACRHCKEVF